MVDPMIELLAGRTLDELTNLVQESKNSLGVSDVRFVIRPLHYEMRNWYIDAEPAVPLHEDEQRVLTGVGSELRKKYYLLLSDAPSPYAA
jgi:hypothetical protein